jgi:hypothetical protein
VNGACVCDSGWSGTLCDVEEGGCSNPPKTYCCETSDCKKIKSTSYCMNWKSPHANGFWKCHGL